MFKYGVFPVELQQKMKAKFNFLIGMLLLAFLLPAVAADSNLNIASISFPSSVAHGSSNTLTFTLQNLNTTGFNISSVNYIITTPWNTISVSSSNINSNSASSISVTVSVPQYTVAGAYIGTITATGLLDGVTPVSDLKQFSINVASSPALTITWITSPQDVYQTENTTAVVNISNTGNVDFSSASINITDFNTTSFSAVPIALAKNSSALWQIMVNTTKKTNYGPNSITVAAKGVDATGLINATASSYSTFNVMYRYCAAKNNDTSRININDITNRDDISGETFGPLDKITVKLSINNNYEKDRTAIVSAILVYKTSTVDNTEVEKRIDIKHDSQKAVDLNFTIPVDAAEGNYYIYVRAYDDASSKYCDQGIGTEMVIPLIIEKSSTHKIEPYELKVLPENVSCGSAFIASGKLANTGSSDETKLLLTYTDPWTISTRLYNDVSSGDTLDFSFSSAVPNNASVGSASFSLSLSYYYDEDSNTYGKTDTQTSAMLNVNGINCIKVSNNVSISTDIPVQQVFTGTQSDVKILVSNSGTVKQTYTVEVPALSWATVNSISPASFDLETGASTYVTVKLTPNADAIGSQSMNVKVNYGGISQTSAVSLNAQKISSVSSFLDKLKFDTNGSLIWYIIGALVVVIVILWIIISSSKRKIRMMRKETNSEKAKQYKNF